MRITYILYNANSPVCRHGTPNYMKRAQAMQILYVIPRYHLWARFVNLSGMHQLVNAFFDRILMPYLDKWNKRRQSREFFEKLVPKIS